jgi:PGF-pre-PGF domain-containing protein
MDLDTPGITVTPGTGTETVSAVTLADEDLRGTVDIKEYRNPPRAVTESVARTVARNITRGPPANDSDGNGSDTNETAANASTNESTATDRVNVVTVANISVFDEEGKKASNTAATVTMDINADDVTNPENATIVHETDSGWEELNTSVVNATNETVTLAAETGGFSLFAVAEIEDDNDESPTRDASDVTGDNTPGFGVWVALAVIAGVTLLTWRSGR